MTSELTDWLCSNLLVTGLLLDFCMPIAQIKMDKMSVPCRI